MSGGPTRSLLLLSLSFQLLAHSAFAGPPTTQSVEDEVLDNIRRQTLGLRTIADDELPESFLRRVADRVIRAAYQQRYRIVTADPGSPTSQPGSAPAESGRDPGPLNVTIHRVPPERLKRWHVFPEARPPARGFRAPLAGGEPFPFDLPAAPHDSALHRAALIIAERLARDGIVRTTAAAIAALGAERGARDSAALLADLRAAGLPIDLLACFSDADDPGRAPAAVVREIGERLQRGQSPEQIVVALSKCFRTRQTVPGFRILPDGGETPLDLLRLQLTRGDYWLGVGDGCSVDIARQLLAELPRMRLLVSINDRFVGALADTTQSWPGLERLRVVAEPLPVSQWARDNGVVGTAGDGRARSVVTLVPRFASRGEDGSIFVPGDSLLADGLPAAGLRLAQSPLLFQGGNLLAYRDPVDGRQTLLIGEAEVYRNVGLGLSRDQALEAFRDEFGVDRCVVLPAVSYHIDYEVSVRTVGGHKLVFVNDDPAAARVIFQCGLEALEKAGIISPADAAAARRDLADGKLAEAVATAAGPVFARADPSGHFPLSLANAFSTGPVDSPVGNLRRFLVACDLLAVEAMKGRIDSPDRHTAAYFRSIARREADRRDLQTRLAELGFSVVPVPSLADGEQSVNAVNGLHGPTCYILPAYGGLYSPLDAAAARVFRRELGKSVKVVEIGCSESQRRDGAVRCSVGIIAQPG